ncbi:Lrp/AsnC family transcriptional regulator [Candidatus Woesearchaeota archaeon]|nr:Lrp/AsnC family transcriptional regulator [Candidatus Woesearchaeota archaeon]
MLDNKDNKILSVLRGNSRMPIRDIAKKTQLRPSTVHQRLMKLKKNVIEKFTVKLDNKLVGEDFIVFMLIKTKPGVDIADTFFRNKHLKEVFGVTGEYDLLVKMKFADVGEFNDFIIKFRKEQRVETTTMIATTNIKEEL